MNAPIADEQIAAAACIEALIVFTDQPIELNEQGSALLKNVLTPEECVSLSSLYPNEAGFRSRVVMGRHGFGRGEYKYFSYPLPGIIQGLRTALYRNSLRLQTVGTKAWGLKCNIRRNTQSSSSAVMMPANHALRRCCCNTAPETTTVYIRISMASMSFRSKSHFFSPNPGRDFEGGEFVLTEQRPRMQSRPEVVPLRQGDAVAFAVHHRPVQGTRGVYRVNLRHGVSRLQSGHRHTLGVIFHDAS